MYLGVYKRHTHPGTVQTLNRLDKAPAFGPRCDRGLWRGSPHKPRAPQLGPAHSTARLMQERWTLPPHCQADASKTEKECPKIRRAQLRRWHTWSG